jgi:hypothetical protein
MKNRVVMFWKNPNLSIDQATTDSNVVLLLEEWGSNCFASMT